MRTTRQDNDRLVNADHSVRFGLFDRPIERINLLDARPWGLPLPRPLRALRLKEWQAVQIVHDRYFVIIALFNAKSVGLVQVKIYDREERRKYMYERKVAPWSFRPADQLLDSRCAYEGAGARVAFTNRLAHDELALDVDIAATKDTPALRIALTAQTAGQTPMVVSIPFATTHGMYSHKGVVPVQGTLQVGDAPAATLAPGNACMMLDDHKGYYPWTMVWDWVTAGRWVDGELCGFNLTRNASIDPVMHNENAFWRGGRLHQLPAVRFERDEGSSPETWRIRDDAGLVDVRFRVEMDGRVELNLLVVESRYRGPFGHFEGTLRSLDGEELCVDGYFGMGEAFFLRM